MVFLRYIQLCFSILWVIMGGGPPPRRARGDLSNYARSFYVQYYLHKKKGTF